MLTIIAILVTDLILLVVFVTQYRQELGGTVNGAHDTPPVRPKPRRRTPPPPPADPGRQIARR